MPKSNLILDKYLRRNELVVGFPIDEGVIGFQTKYDFAAVSPAYDIWKLRDENQSMTFLELLFRSDHARTMYRSKMRGTANRRRTIDKADFLDIGFPLPPLAVQQEIVAEIEGYQKIIDGARQVMENYKPRIEVRPEWPMVELGEVCEAIMDGTHFSPENSADGEYRYVTAKNIKENGLDFSSSTYITKEEHDKIYARCSVKQGDVLYIKDGATAGIAALNTLEQEFSLLSSVAVLRGKADQLDNKFICIYLNSRQGKEAMLALVSGVAITRLTLTKIKSATIPLPDLETQRAIVAEIEEEQRLVGASRELIGRFEAKITAAINRVWGAGE